MSIKSYIYIATLAILASCSDDLPSPTYTVGEADNAIVLRAGISEGGAGVMTRAGAEVSNHTNPGHVNFTSGTKLTLRVDGTWTDHNPSSISKTTTASTGDVTGTDDKHNKVIFSTTSNPVEQLYWDDYGTADPANASTGRTAGLTIYGAAVDGETTAPTISSWTAQTWNVGTPTDNVIDQTGGWSAKDLLTSNNVQTENGSLPYSTDGTYKFDARDAGKLLEFTHAMTKITVNLTAGEGFPGWSTSTPNDGKFNNTPSVILKGFNYIGKVDVEGKTSTPTQADGTTETTPVATADITMHTVTGGNVHKATLDALVFPGNQFTATIAADDPKFTPTSSNPLLELNADGNIYKVTAAQLVKAMNAAGTTGDVNGTLEQGKNYILNIIVNKTDIEVTATVKDWIEVEAGSETPKIDIDTAYGIEADGTTEKSFTNAFDFFRSTNINSGYSNDATVTYNSSESKYDFSTPLYWPDHSTHYFFRGVYPKVGDAPLTPSGKFSTSTGNASTIAVQNAKYETEKYPSDLAIGYPRTTNETCTHGSTVATNGICATEGEIRMNFRYVMSQVEVELQTVNDPASATININENTVVELVNVYNSGEVKLSDGSVSVSGDEGNYILNPVTGSGNELKRHSAIVPQTLTYSTAGATTNLRFKITVTNDDAVLYADATEYNAAKGTSIDDAEFAALSQPEKTKTPATTDVYYADVEPILKSDKSGKVAPNGKWESGVHYKYVLKLSKTAINVTATITDWVEVTASDDVWF